MIKIDTNRAPKAVGPYSQGISFASLIFTSGQLPINPINNQIPSSFAEQVHQSCQNVKVVLEAANSSLQQVVKTTCYLQNIEDFTVFNEIYSHYFTNQPARSCVAVKALPKGVMVEIEAIAYIKESL